MSTSLRQLVENLDKNDLTVLKKFVKNEKTRELLTRKGVFPYDWFDNIEKLDEKKLPEKEKFYSKLNDEHISDKDYEHAQKVWKKLGIKNMREYNLYLKTDVILLSDVFENFRKLCKENYGVDPAWYFTTPGVARDAMLKMTKVELELITDTNMYLMIEKGIRGGISQISKRYAKANNKYMGKDYNPKEKSVYLPYLDANNLYGWAMSQKRPVRDFRWMSGKELETWRKIACILEVDLEYPLELHDLHNEYSSAAEKIKIGNVKKLITTLNNKKRYVVHHETLKLYEKLGIKITKIHKGVKFY